LREERTVTPAAFGSGRWNGSVPFRYERGESSERFAAIDVSDSDDPELGVNIVPSQMT
jgi:hypothetical protein